jgi:hypothetical protein
MGRPGHSNNMTPRLWVWLGLTFELELSLDRVSRIHFEAALCSEGSRRQQRTQAYSTALLGHG